MGRMGSTKSNLRAARTIQEAFNHEPVFTQFALVLKEEHAKRGALGISSRRISGFMAVLTSQLVA
jgi:hypothetical protein